MMRLIEETSNREPARTTLLQVRRNLLLECSLRTSSRPSRETLSESWSTLEPSVVQLISESMLPTSHQCTARSSQTCKCINRPSKTSTPWSQDQCQTLLKPTRLLLPRRERERKSSSTTRWPIRDNKKRKRDKERRRELLLEKERDSTTSRKRSCPT
jgi:hypothetical protein